MPIAETNSELIAGLAGPMLAAVAIAVLANRKVVEAVAGGAANSPALIMFAGMLTLVAGLAIVRAHNIWAADWRVVVTILGWLAVIVGLVRIILPDRVAAVGARIHASSRAMTVWALVALALGLFLMAKGYRVLG